MNKLHNTAFLVSSPSPTKRNSAWQQRIEERQGIHLVSVLVFQMTCINKNWIRQRPLHSEVGCQSSYIFSRCTRIAAGFKNPISNTDTTHSYNHDNKVNITACRTVSESAIPPPPRKKKLLFFSIGLCVYQELLWHFPTCLLDWSPQNLPVRRLLQTMVFHFQRCWMCSSPAYWWYCLLRSREITKSPPGPSYRGILVYNICLISISNSVSDGTTNKSVLNFESS